MTETPAVVILAEGDYALVESEPGAGCGRCDGTKGPAGEEVGREQLTGTVGGSVSWSAIYDAVLNRFSFHDPLDDLGKLAPSGVDRDCASYVVAGWWSDPSGDPLDKARSSDSLHELLERLRWRLMYEWGDEQWAIEQEKAQFELRKALGLTTSDRWSSPRPTPDLGLKAPRAAQKVVAAPHVPIETMFMEEQKLKSSSAFATEAGKRYVADPWHLRSSLLHGAIYGVRVSGAPPVDQRPGSGALSIANGQIQLRLWVVLMKILTSWGMLFLKMVLGALSSFGHLHPLHKTYCDFARRITKNTFLLIYFVFFLFFKEMGEKSKITPLVIQGRYLPCRCGLEV